MFDHYIVVSLYSAVVVGGRPDAAVQSFKLADRVTRIENDNIVEFPRYSDVVGHNGTTALTDRDDPQIALAELQERAEGRRLDAPTEQFAVTMQLEPGEARQSNRLRFAAMLLLCIQLVADQTKAFTEVGHYFHFRAAPTGGPLSEPAQRTFNLSLADAVAVSRQEALIPEDEITPSTLKSVEQVEIGSSVLYPAMGHEKELSCLIVRCLW
jgi:hypothetical protein